MLAFALAVSSNLSLIQLRTKEVANGRLRKKGKAKEESSKLNSIDSGVDL